MKIRLWFLFVLSAFVLSGCNEDDVDFPLKGKLETITVQDGTAIKVRTDTVCRLLSNDYKCLPADPANPNDVEQLKRYTDIKKDKYWMRAVFGKWCETMGLKEGVEYFIRREYCYQAIADKPGYVITFYMPENSNMGFVEQSDGGLYIGYMGNPATDLYEEADGNCRTMVIYIGYDCNGKSVGKYYPCNPSDLEWHYSWIDITNLKLYRGCVNLIQPLICMNYTNSGM